MYFLSLTLHNNLVALFYYQLTETICGMFLDYLSKKETNTPPFNCVDISSFSITRNNG